MDPVTSFLVIVVLPLSVFFGGLVILGSMQKRICYFCNSPHKGFVSIYGILFTCKNCGQDNINPKILDSRKGPLYP